VADCLDALVGDEVGETNLVVLGVVATQDAL
jgi:hypothetical protein